MIVKTRVLFFSSAFPATLRELQQRSPMAPNYLTQVLSLIYPETSREKGH
jgi:hypothetical protein